MARHLAAALRILRVPVRLGNQRLEGESLPERRPGLAVRGEDPVPFLEGHRAPDLARFLARAWHIEADAALALEREHAGIERADEDEVPVRRPQRIRRKLRFELGIVRAIEVDDSEHSFFRRSVTPANSAVVPG